MNAKLQNLIVVLLCTLPVVAGAQKIDLDVTQRGDRDFLINAIVDNAAVLNITSALATETGFELQIASPDVSKVLSENVISVKLKQTDLSEFIDLLAMSCGLRFDVMADDKKIDIQFLPKPGEPGASEYFRTQALDSVVNAYAGDATPENEVELLLRTADLHEVGGDWAQAYNAYRNFTQNFKTHKLFPKAVLSAAETAIKAGLDEEALARVDQFLKDAPEDKGTGKALILGAQARMMRNDVVGAMALYKTVIRKSLDLDIPERDGLVAEYYVAQLHHKKGDNAAAIKLLEEIEWRHNAKHNRDLLDQVWLYLGICRNAQGNRRDALHDLNLAVFTNVVPSVRIRVLLLSADIYLKVNNPFFALNAARAAVALDAKGRDLFMAMTLQGKAYRALFLHGRAQDILLKAILQSPSLIKDEQERLTLTTATMREVGEDFFEDSNFVDALSAFRTIHEAAEKQQFLDQGDFSDEFIAEMKYMIAKCQERLGNYKQALKTLDGIANGVGSETFVKELRQLRGDCFMSLKMYERAIRTWNQGDRR